MDSIFCAMDSRREHLPPTSSRVAGPVLRTALSKVKRGFGRSFVPDDSESFRELTDGARFDMLAR
jgi:hypothetical protein